MPQGNVVSMADRQDRDGDGALAPYDPNKRWDIDQLKNAVEDYIDSKCDEISEQKTARRYYHGAQLTPSQIKAIERRRIAPVVYNRIQPKIDEMVGLLDRIKQDPKAYPRGTQIQDGEGPDIVTQTLRFELDEAGWQFIEQDAGQSAMVDGIGVVELTLDQEGDGYDPGIKWVDPADYMYDPKTFRLDFEDCRWDAVGKWYTIEDAIAQWPESAEKLIESVSSGGAETRTYLSSYPEKDEKWFIANRRHQIEYVRVVELWYKSAKGYKWAIFTGAHILYEGDGHFFDDKGRQISKWLKFANNRDQDGDVYGFVRNMKSPQDEINAWKMGLNYDILSRRIIITGDDPQNVETIRKEWARKDGTVILPSGTTATLDDKSVDIKGAMDAIGDAKLEIERYGLDNTAMGQDPNLSGAAISLLQAAGLSRMGPFLKEWKRWKLKVYRAMWAQIQRYWTGMRWIRVVDDDQQAQAIAVNALQIAQDPMTGQMVPRIQNQLGSMDVDIIMDEGPDVINAMQMTHDNLMQMRASGQDIPPELLIETSPNDPKTKKKLLEALERGRQAQAQPNPMEVASLEAEIQMANAQSAELQAKAQKLMAEAKGLTDDVALAKKLAEIEKTLGQAEQARATAVKNVSEVGAAMPADPGPQDIMADAKALEELRQAAARRQAQEDAVEIARSRAAQQFEAGQQKMNLDRAAALQRMAQQGQQSSPTPGA